MYVVDRNTYRKFEKQNAVEIYTVCWIFQTDVYAVLCVYLYLANLSNRTWHWLCQRRLCHHLRHLLRCWIRYE